MSLLSDIPPRIHTAWSTDATHEPSDVARLGPGIWSSMATNRDTERLCLALLPESGAPPFPQASPFFCWAIQADELVDDSISIPPSWIIKYPRTFTSGPGRKIFANKVVPVVLSSIFITAEGQDAYTALQCDPSIIHRLVFDGSPILRQGMFLTDPQHPSFQFNIEVVEPVTQGYAAPGTTNITVSLARGTLRPSSDLTSATSDSDLEIDERFLESSSITRPLQKHPDDPLPGINADLHATCTLLPLIHARDVSAEHCTLYARTSVLGRLGLLTRDWATLSGKTSKRRIVRVVADDTLDDNGLNLFGSPILLHNIFFSDGDSFCNSQGHVVTLRPSPFGCSSPAVPTAKSITIARVASPISTNKRFQNAFLQSLKQYLDNEKRLVKEGDVICVSVDTDASRYEEHDGDSYPLDTRDSSRHPISHRRPNELVFFKVSSVECAALPFTDASTQGLYASAILGELGCWVDSSITRVIQTGVEHSRVPNARSYMGIGTPSDLVLANLLASPTTPQLLSPKSPYSKLLSFASAVLTPPAVDYDLNLSFLLQGGRGVGKFTTCSWVAQRLGLHLFEVDAYEVIGESETKTEATLRVRFEQASSCAPCIIFVRHLEAFAQSTQPSDPPKESSVVIALRECIEDVQRSWRMHGYPVIVVGATSDPGRVPPSLLTSFKQEIVLETPNEVERYEILEALLRTKTLAADVSLGDLAVQTAALLATDLQDLVVRAERLSVERLANQTSDLSEAVHSLPHVVCLGKDLDSAVNKVRDAYSESIGAPKIPSVSWDDIGGLAHVKSDILDTIQLPLDHPELFADGLKKRSGILLYGPPGTGKTLIAKAVATSCSLNFFSVKGPELLNMYIGESEANVRRVFQRARDARPCVIFFDELDSVAPKRGNHGDSGGVMDRIVSQLLAELDGMSGGKDAADVFVIGATNRPDLLDPALLRPGRFDRMLYLGVSETHEAQLNILEALTRKFRLDPGLDLRNVANRCPFNYTGADFYALCSDAMLNAMSRTAERVDVKIGKLLFDQSGLFRLTLRVAALNREKDLRHPHPVTPQYYLSEMATTEDILVQVSQADFDRALDNLVPSVSQAEMEHYRQVQERFSQATVVQ